MAGKIKELKIVICNAWGKRLETSQELNKGLGQFVGNKKPGLSLQGFISLNVNLLKQPFVWRSL